jgi:hypothetical protein
MYDGLLDEGGLGDLLGISDGDIGRFFKDAPFGAEHVARDLLADRRADGRA